VQPNQEDIRQFLVKRKRRNVPRQAENGNHQLPALEGVWQLLQSSPICSVGLHLGSGSDSEPFGSYIVGGSDVRVMDVGSDSGLAAPVVA